MKRCEPTEMRKNLEIVNQFKLAGIDFVAIPVLNENEKEIYLKLMDEQFEKMLKECEE